MKWSPLSVTNSGFIHTGNLEMKADFCYELSQATQSFHPEMWMLKCVLTVPPKFYLVWGFFCFSSKGIFFSHPNKGPGAVILNEAAADPGELWDPFKGSVRCHTIVALLGIQIPTGD